MFQAAPAAYSGRGGCHGQSDEAGTGKGEAMNDLETVIRDEMSPQAVALAIAYLSGASGAQCKETTAVCEVHSFVRRLTALVGGPEALSDLYEEIGV